jgi:His-Xaa-Ser system protein HxsD
MEFTLNDETSIQIKIDRSLYSSEVVHKCLYWYANKYSVEIKTEGNSFIIYLSNHNKEYDIKSVVSKIKTDLVDFKTREIISNETKNIREMLVAKAFAHNDEFEEKPSGNINDPVGFDPHAV